VHPGGTLEEAEELVAGSGVDSGEGLVVGWGAVGEGEGLDLGWEGTGREAITLMVHKLFTLHL
jgi:hypothetical protein